MQEKKKEIAYISIEEIYPNRYQPKLSFDEKDLNELANSILKYGVIQPLVVRPLGTKYEIIAGERRYRAAIIAGLKKIPVILVVMDDVESADLSLLENIKTKNLSIIEEAKFFKKLIDMGFTQDDIATKLGISQIVVADKIKLLNLPEEVQSALLYNQITEKHARALLRLNNYDLQNNLLKRIISERMTEIQTETEVALTLDNDSKGEMPEEIKRFLTAEKIDNLPLEEEKKEEVVEVLNFDIPNIVEENEEPKKENLEVKFEDTPPLINPFQSELNIKEELASDLRKEEKVIDETPNKLETEKKDEAIEMPSNPFSEASSELSETITETEEKPQKSILEQLKDVEYTYKEPTISDLNISEEYGKIERIGDEKELTEQEEETQEIDEEYLNEYGEIDLPKVINSVREFTKSLGSASELIETSEIDLPDKYQINIEIKKN